MAYADFQETRFRKRVEQALQQARLLLDSTSQPQLMDTALKHTYNDKFLMAVALTNSSLVALRDCLGRLGVTEVHWRQWSDWVAQNRTVTLRFVAADSCAFLNETEHIVEDHSSSTQTNNESTAPGWESTGATRSFTRVAQTMKRAYWKLTVRHGLVAFGGNDTENVTTIRQRISSTVIFIPGAKGWSPIPPHTEHRPVDLDLTWFVQQFQNVACDATEQSTVECCFAIDRDAETTKTPRRNADIQRSWQFHTNISEFMRATGSFFANRVRTDILNKVSDGKYEKVPLRLCSVFFPMIPLMEGGIVFPDADLFAAAHARTLDGALTNLKTQFPTNDAPELLSVTEASIVLVGRHVCRMSWHYQDCVAYLEQMLFDQVVQAVGKRLAPDDLASYMTYHGQQLFQQQFKPQPLCYPIRQQGFDPDGMFGIQSGPNNPIQSTVRHVCLSRDGTPLEIPLNASVSALMTGNCFLHGCLLYQLGSASPPQLSLVARARQFGSFLLVIGTMNALQLEPKHAILIQGKDDLLIPLLSQVLPSVRGFKDAVSSLSPEQQEFCKAYRSMQLESSVFGVAVIRLKPQLEKVLRLLPGSLSKEIQLVQDLTNLFVEYQIPSDLLSFDGPEVATKEERVEAVKGHVKSVMAIISNEKEKIIVAEDQRAAYAQASNPREDPIPSSTQQHAAYSRHSKPRRGPIPSSIPEEPPTIPGLKATVRALLDTRHDRRPNGQVGTYSVNRDDVIWSVSICTGQGKTLLSRQYVCLSRQRLDGLLGAFTSVTDGHFSETNGHFETGGARYVYQRLGSALYLLLITSTASNHVSDVKILNLLTDVIKDIAGSYQEQAITDKLFELIFGFDEVVSPGGYKEDACNLSRVHEYLRMNSQEERAHVALMESKEKESRAKYCRGASELRKQKMARMQQTEAPGKTTAPEQGGKGGPGNCRMPNSTMTFLDSLPPPRQLRSGSVPLLQTPAPVSETPPKVLTRAGMFCGNKIMARMEGDLNLGNQTSPETRTTAFFPTILPLMILQLFCPFNRAIFSQM